MITQWILQTLVCAVVGCIIGYFGIRITNKLRLRKFKHKVENQLEASLKSMEKELGFTTDEIKLYAPELVNIFNIQNSNMPYVTVMFMLYSAYSVKRQYEEFNWLAIEAAVNNIKTQKALENIE